VTEEKSVFSPEGEKRKRKKKATNVSDKYYHLSEDEMQILIGKAKSGDPTGQEELLKVFDNFIMKYCALLYRGKYDLHDYDIRRFISLFIPDKTISVRLTRNQINNATYKAVNEVMRGINYMVRRYCDEIDVRQTVQVTFLQCIARYERRGSIPFSGYIYSYFFYLLKRNVDFFLISQVGRNTFPLHTDDNVSSSFPNTEEQTPTNVPLSPSVEDMLGPDQIDEYWIMGETAIFPFDRLTVHQRQLIKWRYVDGLKASHIAERITEHPNTCRAQLQAIKDELASILKEEFDI
jgi:hypothetical protein